MVKHKVYFLQLNNLDKYIAYPYCIIHMQRFYGDPLNYDIIDFDLNNGPILHFALINVNQHVIYAKYASENKLTVSKFLSLR